MDLRDHVCKICGERFDGHTETLFVDSGKTRTKKFETDHPIFETIRGLDISQATKAYALFAAQRIIENGEGQTGQYKSTKSAIRDFCRWMSTTEGDIWWNNLDDGEDPGIPGETKPMEEKTEKRCKSCKHEHDLFYKPPCNECHPGDRKNWEPKDAPDKTWGMKPKILGVAGDNLKTGDMAYYENGYWYRYGLDFAAEQKPLSRSARRAKVFGYLKNIEEVNK